MFARFTSQTRRVIDLAEDHARALWCPAVGPEHLLLALLAVDDSNVFVRAGLHFDAVRARLLDANAGQPPPDHAGQADRRLPLRLREVFRDAFRHAALLGDERVKPLHLALALVDDPPGEISMVLRGIDVDPAVIRDAVLDRLLLEAEAVEQASNVVSLIRRHPGHDARACARCGGALEGDDEEVEVAGEVYAGRRCSRCRVLVVASA